MRWQWRNAIRYLDWQKLEEYVESEPCGQLADTLYELSIGLDDKVDVYKAKQLIYQLEKQGITPSQTAGPRLVKYRKASAGSFGVMSTTDWQGMQYVALVQSTGRKVRVISGLVNHCGGFAKMDTFEFPFSHFHRLRGKIMLAGVKDRRAVVLSPEYMLNRIAWYRDKFGFVDGVSREIIHKSVPYWDKLMDKCDPQFPPLADSVLPAAPGTCDTANYWQEHPWAKHWRLPIHNNLYPELMPELQRIEAQVKDTEKRFEERLAYLLANRELIIKDWFPFDYEMRFMDLATFAMIDDDEDCAKKCIRVHMELIKKGTASPMFDSLITATARDLQDISKSDLVDTKHYLFHPGANLV